jgi:hypothetical protein
MKAADTAIRHVALQQLAYHREHQPAARSRVGKVQVNGDNAQSLALQARQAPAAGGFIARQIAWRSGAPAGASGVSCRGSMTRAGTAGRR